MSSRTQRVSGVTVVRDQRPLSPQQAFVVQFREGSGGAQQQCTGRVEHIVSGQAARFHSQAELWAFFAQVLGQIGGDP
jgi:hypothetical protein